MKGLIFNLLQSSAQDAGCSDEAWELVAEFAGADRLTEESIASLEETTQRAFEVPAEAMLRCLSRGDEHSSSQLPSEEFELVESLSSPRSTMSLLQLPPTPSLSTNFGRTWTSANDDFETDSNAALDAMYRWFGLGPNKTS